MGLLGLITTLAWGAPPECEPTDEVVKELVDVVAAAIDVERIENLLETAKQSLACGEPASPEDLASFWQSEAYWLHKNGDKDSAKEAVRAAQQASRTIMVPAFREVILMYVEQLEGELAPSPQKVELSPALDSYESFLDGRPTRFPTVASVGHHVLQVREPGASILYGDIVNVVPRLPEANRITLTIQNRTPPTSSPLQEPVSKRPAGRNKAFLAVSGITAAGAAGTAIGALAQNDIMRNAPTAQTNDAAFSRQRALGYTSYSLMGVTATSLVLHFAL